MVRGLEKWLWKRAEVRELRVVQRRGCVQSGGATGGLNAGTAGPRDRTAIGEHVEFRASLPSELIAAPPSAAEAGVDRVAPHEL